MFRLYLGCVWALDFFFCVLGIFFWGVLLDTR